MISQQKSTKLYIVHIIFNNELKHKEASKILSLSERQIRRFDPRLTPVSIDIFTVTVTIRILFVIIIFEE